MADKPLPAAPHQPCFPGRTHHSLQFGAELGKFRQLSSNTAGNMTSSSPPPWREWTHPTPVLGAAPVPPHRGASHHTHAYLPPNPPSPAPCGLPGRFGTDWLRLRFLRPLEHGFFEKKQTTACLEPVSCASLGCAGRVLPFVHEPSSSP